MFHLKTIISLSILVISGNLITSFMQRWTYDLIEMTYNSSNTEAVEMFYQIERIERGRYGFSGFLDIKIDLDDDTLIDVTMQRSKDKEGPYKPMAMNISNETISVAFNNFYKRMLMKTVAECCENAPVFKDKFKAPLTKRRILINKCEISTDGFPSVMMEGYYLMRTTIFAETVIAYLQTLLYIENN